MKKKLLIITIIIAIIGALVVIFKGFNVSSNYRAHKSINIPINADFNIEDVQTIADEIFGKKNAYLERAGVYNDSVVINVKDVSDEQLTNLKNKINEKYQIALAADSQEIQTIPQTRIIDILNHYLLAFGVSSIIILVYMAIRYRKLNALKVIFKTVLALVVTEAVLFAIFAITQIPFGKYTVALVFIAYVFALAVIVNKFENKLTKIKLEEKKQK